MCLLKKGKVEELQDIQHDQILLMHNAPKYEQRQVSANTKRVILNIN